MGGGAEGMLCMDGVVSLRLSNVIDYGGSLDDRRSALKVWSFGICMSLKESLLPNEQSDVITFDS